MTDPNGDRKRDAPGRTGRPDATPGPAHPTPDERLIDESVDQTFPASDPQVWSGTSLGEPSRDDDTPAGSS